jgi:hypothetical protein
MGLSGNRVQPWRVGYGRKLGAAWSMLAAARKPVAPQRLRHGSVENAGLATTKAIKKSALKCLVCFPCGERHAKRDIAQPGRAATAHARAHAIHPPKSKRFALRCTRFRRECRETNLAWDQPCERTLRRLAAAIDWNDFTVVAPTRLCRNLGGLLAANSCPSGDRDRQMTTSAANSTRKHKEARVLPKTNHSAGGGTVHILKVAFCRARESSMFWAQAVQRPHNNPACNALPRVAHDIVAASRPILQSAPAAATCAGPAPASAHHSDAA